MTAYTEYLLTQHLASHVGRVYDEGKIDAATALRILNEKKEIDGPREDIVREIERITNITQSQETCNMSKKNTANTAVVDDVVVPTTAKKATSKKTASKKTATATKVASKKAVTKKAASPDGSIVVGLTSNQKGPKGFDIRESKTGVRIAIKRGTKRTCSVCQKTKSTDEYAINNSRSDKLHNRCRDCEAEYQKQRAGKTVEKKSSKASLKKAPAKVAKKKVASKKAKSKVTSKKKK